MKVRKSRRRRVWLLVSLLLCPSLALASDVDINFSGFASLAYAKTIGGGDGPYNNITDEGEYRDLNTLGLRMDADLYEGVSFAAQMVAYGTENYQPEFDWIFASIDLTPELRLDVGKSRVPMYMYSDFIDVGYAYQWIKPPSTVYVAGRSFFQSVEGLKLNYVTAIADWESELLVYGGKTEEHFTSLDGTEQVDLIIENLAGAAWTVERDWLTLRAVYTEGDITLGGYSSFDRLLSAIHGLGASINFVEPYVDQSIDPISIGDFEDMVALRKDTLRFAGVGVGLDFDRVFGVMEMTQSLFDHNIASNNSVGGYLTAGVRLPHQFTLSASYGSRKQNPNTKILETYAVLISNYVSQVDLTTSSLDPNVNAAVGMINELLDGDGISDMEDIIGNAIRVTQDKNIHEYSLQLRWDFHRMAAFKFEYMLQHTHQYSSSTYRPEKVEPQAYRIGVDVVF